MAAGLEAAVGSGAGAGLGAGAGSVAGVESVAVGALGCVDDGAGVGDADLDLVCRRCRLWGPARGETVEGVAIWLRRSRRNGDSGEKERSR